MPKKIEKKDPLSTPIASASLYKVFTLMSQKKWKEAEKLVIQGIAETKQDPILHALFYSAYGVFYKLKKDFRKAWKYYEQAEKLIPDDPSLKLISARLLLDYFGQYDTVIRKMDKILEATGQKNFPLVHRALTLKGLAFLKKGNKKKTVDCLKDSIGREFFGLESAVNFDFALVAEMIRKKIEPQACQDFLQAARRFIQETHENTFEPLIRHLEKKVS